MSTTEIIENLQYILNSLNAINVNGKDNLNYLLGSIMVLEKIKASLKAQKLEQENKPAE